MFGKKPGDNTEEPTAPSKKRDANRTYRMDLDTLAHLGELTAWQGRASDNNTITWLINKEHRKLRRRRAQDGKEPEES